MPVAELERIGRALVALLFVAAVDEPSGWLYWPSPPTLLLFFAIAALSKKEGHQPLMRVVSLSQAFRSMSVQISGLLVHVG